MGNFVAAASKSALSETEKKILYNPKQASTEQMDMGTPGMDMPVDSGFFGML